MDLYRARVLHAALCDARACILPIQAHAPPPRFCQRLTAISANRGWWAPLGVTRMDPAGFSFPPKFRPGPAAPPSLVQGPGASHDLAESSPKFWTDT